MPEYLAPGVFIEEVPSGPVPIQGVSTSTAGFVGAAERGPTRPVLVTSWLDYQRWFGGLPSQDNIMKYGYMAHSVAGFFANGGQRAYIARVTNDKPNQYALVASGSKGKMKVDAIGPGDEGLNLFVKIKEGSQGGGRFAVSIAYFRGGYPSGNLDGGKTIKQAMDPDFAANSINAGFVGPTAHEAFDNLSSDPDAPNYFMTVINSGSNLVQVEQGDPQANYEPPTVANMTNAKYTRLTKEGSSTVADAIPEQKQYEGVGGPDVPVNEQTGLAALGSIRDVNILCVPDQAMNLSTLADLTNKVIQHCELHRNRFAILASTQGNNTISTMMPPADTSYCAYYYPWINVRHPDTGNIISLPASGHLAGVYARTDIERGVHKAPANEMLFGPLGRNVGDYGPLNPNVSDGQQQILNPRGVNCIRDFRDQGRGILVWGARTMSQNGQWRYVNVRRLFIYVEQSVELGTQWVVFEPNDPSTWQRVVNSVKGFLNTLWHNGALMGSTPEEAFFVRCDRTTMTQDDIDNGRLICLVGIAPVKPAEFVIFRFSQKTAED